MEKYFQIKEYMYVFLKPILIGNKKERKKK